jgi:uncharacterized protein YdhG (YjbR/CyaY superfamily)
MRRYSSVQKYLQAQKPEHRKALQALRKTIRSAAPKATEKLAWGMPSFNLNGTLVCYAGFKEHMSFFPMSATTLDKFKKETKGFAVSKGTLRFTAEKPLPEALVKRIVKERMMYMMRA